MEAILGLIGVALGWGLGELSGAFNRSREERRMIGRVLSTLMSLKGEMATSQAAIEGVKDLGLSIGEFESLRQRYAKRYLDDTPGLSEERAKAIEDLSGLMPIEAQELRWVLRSYTFLPNVSLHGYAKLDTTAYIKALSAIEASILVGRRRLDQIIASLAWKYGLVTWLRLKVRQRRINKLSPKLGEKNKVALELKELLQQMRTESSSDTQQETDRSSDAG
ncbi:hypothetical protein [Marinimicrobium sp. ARAG 43.8]|uniref:hypothetical protein n=1 Tax=Marinimicrobium sp. ARAG 43.8 TaxID=3418719 RepID=UPI003CE90A71